MPASEVHSQELCHSQDALRHLLEDLHTCGAEASEGNSSGRYLLLGLSHELCMVVPHLT